MAERADLLRIDGAGVVHPVGTAAREELLCREGEWRLLGGSRDALLLRPVREGPLLRMAGEVCSRSGLYDVVALIAQSGWTGELCVKSERSARSIFFEEGNVLAASSNVEDERLGETLYRFGVVTREQLTETLVAAKLSGRRLGEVAVELDFVSREDLYNMMTRQMEEVFYRALRVDRGVYYFFDRFDERSIHHRHPMNAGALLMEAARRVDEMQLFREKIPSSDYVPVPVPAKGKVPDDLSEVYQQCDGRRDISAIGRRTGLLEFEVTHAVFQLLSGGFVSVSPARPHGAREITEAFNPALREIHRRCDEAGKGKELREGLSRFAVGGGIFDALFMGAGPLPDGTLDARKLARNVEAMQGDDDGWLVQQLYEYAGFALFQAGSLLPREAESQLNHAIAEVLKPLRQTESIVPTSRRI
jgi:hypothetical protein